MTPVPAPSNPSNPTHPPHHLLVAVRLQVGRILAQAILEAVLVALVEALAAGLVDEGQQIHLGGHGDDPWGDTGTIPRVARGRSLGFGRTPPAF